MLDLFDGGGTKRCPPNKFIIYEMSFLLYGANGYTGQLILEEAEQQGIKPVIAGRNEDKIRPLAEKYGLAYRIFNLEDTAKMEAILTDFLVVLHCAGPYVYTTEPMVQACIRTKTHYLDISGRVEGFEYNFSQDEAAKTQGVMLLPGVGFDVVPSDCLVAYLHQKLPDATHLSLAVARKNGGVSHGTALSTVENLGNQKGQIRKAGQIIEVPLAHKKKTIRFGEGYKSVCVTVPWGDVSTAYHTAKIPNVEVYMAVSKGAARFMKFSNRIQGLLRTNFVKNLARKLVNSRPAGPNAAERARSVSYFWGVVRNDRGEEVEAFLKTLEAYTLTAKVALLITQKVVNGQVEAGFQTPAGLLGAGLILEIEGSLFYR